MGPTIFHNGRRWPVNAAWAAANIAPYPELANEPMEALAAIRDRMLAHANAAGAITPEQRAALEAVVHHYDVRKALVVLGEPDHRAFGFGGVDQLHGNANHMSRACECGCVLAIVIDHHVHQAKAWAQDARTSAAVLKRLDNAPALAKAGMAKRLAMHEAGLARHARLAGVHHLSVDEIAALEPPDQHHRPHFVCELHAHLAHDPAALHAAVMADNAGVAEAVDAAYRAHAEEEEAKANAAAGA